MVVEQIVIETKNALNIATGASLLQALSNSFNEIEIGKLIIDLYKHCGWQHLLKRQYE